MYNLVQQRNQIAYGVKKFIVDDELKKPRSCYTQGRGINPRGTTLIICQRHTTLVP